MANVEEYNDNLHEEVHQLHNQLHPFLGATEDDDNDGVSDMDSDHDE